MGSRRLGAGANLTPDQAKKKLAIPCTLVLLGAARVDFGLTTVAKPARTVHIRRNSKTQGVLESVPLVGTGLQFQVVAVNEKQWDTAVRSVLENSQFNLGSPLNQHLLNTGNVASVVEVIGEALRLSFIDAGYGPA